MAIDYSSLDPLKTAATTAGTNYANMVQSAPSLLQDLQKNLTSIFATDNPIINARTNALSTYLTTPSQTRADLLTPNMPSVEGSPLTLSPTQQNAIVTGRSAAALAPLIGLNQAVTGIYGNIPQMVQNTGNIYSSLLAGEKAKADLANTAYENAFKELTTKEQLRLQELSTMLTASGANTAAGRAESVLNNVAADAKGGSTLDDIMKKYSTSGYVTPADILRVYNTNSIYGAAKESPTLLQSKYGVKSTLTADQQNRQAAFGVSESVINNALNSPAISKAGTAQANKIKAFSAIPFGLGKASIGKNDQDLYNLNQTLELIKLNILRAFQGGRISDADYRLASGYVPSIQDNPETIKNQLRQLTDFISGMTGSSGGGSQGGWEIVQ